MKKLLKNTDVLFELILILLVFITSCYMITSISKEEKSKYEEPINAVWNSN